MIKLGAAWEYLLKLAVEGPNTGQPEARAAINMGEAADGRSIALDPWPDPHLPTAIRISGKLKQKTGVLPKAPPPEGNVD